MPGRVRNLSSKASAAVVSNWRELVCSITPSTSTCDKTVSTGRAGRRSGAVQGRCSQRVATSNWDADWKLSVVSGPRNHLFPHSINSLARPGCRFAQRCVIPIRVVEFQ
jgi:hypothetical protein